MPDHADVAKRLKELKKEHPGAIPWNERELQDYAAKGRKAEALIQDPLWGVAAKEIDKAILSIDARLEAIRADLEGRAPKEAKDIMAMERERDYAHGMKDAYESVLGMCEELSDEGKVAKSYLLISSQESV